MAMAVVTFAQSVDLTDPSLWSGTLSDVSPFQVTFTGAAGSLALNGLFNFDPFSFTVSGTLSSIEALDSGNVLVLQATGINKDVAAAVDLILDGDVEGLLGHLLSGRDTVDGSTGADLVMSFGDHDLLRGRGGNDTMDGGVGNDRLFGAGGRDSLVGGDGNDRLFGDFHADVLDGGRGRDIMEGGTGADRFLFRSPDAPVPNGVPWDEITDFEVGVDRIDLRAVDAMTGARSPGNDAFDFIGPAGFSAAGQLRIVAVAGGIDLLGDRNGDGVADFGVRLTGLTTFAESDVLL
jgi:Ca2+-binding RTX toxin-like protein